MSVFHLTFNLIRIPWTFFKCLAVKNATRDEIRKMKFPVKNICKLVMDFGSIGEITQIKKVF